MTVHGLRKYGTWSVSTPLLIYYMYGTEIRQLGRFLYKPISVVWRIPRTATVTTTATTNRMKITKHAAKMDLRIYLFRFITVAVLVSNLDFSHMDRNRIRI